MSEELKTLCQEIRSAWKAAKASPEHQEYEEFIDLAYALYLQKEKYLPVLEKYFTNIIPFEAFEKAILISLNAKSFSDVVESTKLQKQALELCLNSDEYIIYKAEYLRAKEKEPDLTPFSFNQKNLEDLND